MSKDAQIENAVIEMESEFDPEPDTDLELSAQEQQLFDELVRAMVCHKFGEAGPPRETAFYQIEQFGHRAGRMVARAIDAEAVKRHGKHFVEEEPCPACKDKKYPPKEDPHDLPLLTPDGEVVLREPAFRCPSCGRDFFPGTHPVEA